MIPFVSLNPTTIPLSPSYFSRHVSPCDMVGPLMDWKFMLKILPLLLLLRLPLSENQNKRWRRHTAPLMATLGSATKVSLNRLVHHFAFVHHDRELCVCGGGPFSALCFYPQMDVLVGLLLLECIISLIPWIIFKTQVFLLTFVCSAMLIDLCLPLTSRCMLCYCLATMPGNCCLLMSLRLC